MDNKSKIITELQFTHVLQDAKNHIIFFNPTENEFTYVEPAPLPLPEIKIPFILKLKDALRKIIPQPIFKRLGVLYRFIKRCIKLEV